MEHNWKETLHYLIKWLVLSAFLAMLCGSLISLYILAINKGEVVRQHHLGMILGLPFVGAAITWMYQKCQVSAQVGNNLLIEKIKGRDLRIPLRAIPVSMFGTIVSHWFGASIGREDIATQLAGGVVDQVDQHLQLRQKEKEWLLLCGLAAGFSCTFGTPIAGTLFALEIAKGRNFCIEALYPVFMTSFFSYEITRLYGLHQASTFVITDYPKKTALTFFILFLLSLCFALLGRLYREGILFVKKWGLKLCKTSVLLTFCGALLVVFFVICFHNAQYLGLSSEMQQQAFAGIARPDGFLWKLFYTILCVGSGFRGGTLTPLFDIGANFGCFMGHFLPFSYSFTAALGFVGVFASATNTPLTCFVLSMELFGGQDPIFFFFVTLTSYVCSGHYSLFPAAEKE